MAQPRSMRLRRGLAAGQSYPLVRDYAAFLLAAEDYKAAAARARYRAPTGAGEARYIDALGRTRHTDRAAGRGQARL